MLPVLFSELFFFYFKEYRYRYRTGNCLCEEMPLTPYYCTVYRYIANIWEHFT